MNFANAEWTENTDDLERLATEEMVEWALDQDYFGTGAFVWDLRHGLNSREDEFLEIDLRRKGPDELLSHISPDDRSALPCDRRRRGR